jgi:hypothetical protein
MNTAAIISSVSFFILNGFYKVDKKANHLVEDVAGF